MKRFLGMDVYTAARLRLEEVFDSFERVYVSFSGGKDSGVAVQLALDVAREKGRLPLDMPAVEIAQLRFTAATPLAVRGS